MDADESVTDWLHQLATDDESTAQQKLWNRYFGQLARIARASKVLLGEMPTRKMWR